MKFVFWLVRVAFVFLWARILEYLSKKKRDQTDKLRIGPTLLLILRWFILYFQTRAFEVIILYETIDIWCWNLGKCGVFSSRSLNRSLSSRVDTGREDLILSVWKGKGHYPPRWWNTEILLFRVEAHVQHNTFDKLWSRTPWISISPNCCTNCFLS